ncbi:aspartate dehydrogenase [Thalassobaculum salexigens]|uniref:aspartate dehydrogenase n=1 Tax=Thalassobaculum salexigens TaxID=455360 RepID=UPI0004084A01|nr:aspartate dehydrogenase [Thalassobaculum salexigens]
MQSKPPLRLGLIGAGAIGAHVIDFVANELEGSIAIPAVLVRTTRPQAANGPDYLTDPVAFHAGEYDVVLEGAGHQAVRDHVIPLLKRGVRVIVTSIGAFTDDALYESCRQAAEEGGTSLTLASAGIGALDILSGAAVGGLDAVEMTVRKDPSAWYGTAAEQMFDLDRMTEPTVIFEGSAREGAATYPQNVNISAAVALAGIGLDRTKLTIVADPTIETHIITVEARGAFGSFSFTENVAVAEENRKTGKIVAMAVTKTVKQLASAVRIGG